MDPNLAARISLAPRAMYEQRLTMYHNDENATT